MDTETTSLVTVWDVSQPGFGRISERAGKWLKDQGVARPTVCSTYRVEFRMAGGVPVAELFTYAGNEQGRHYEDPETNAPAVNPPFTVTLGSLPPDDLRLA